MRGLIGTGLVIVSTAFFVVAGCTVKNEASDTICQPKQKTRCNDCTKTDPTDTRIWRGWTTCSDDGKSFVGTCDQCAPDGDPTTATTPGTTNVPPSPAANSSDAGGGPITPTPKKPDPSNTFQVCTDFGAVVAYNSQRCGGNPEAARTAFIESAADGDCKNIVAVRDVDSLYATCFPTLDADSCDDITSGPLDPSCTGQLLETVPQPGSVGGT